MRAYIAGPMTNRPHFNFPTFDAVAAAWRALGNEAVNPHEHDQEVYPGIDEAAATQVGDVVGIREEVGFSYTDAMVYDLGEVIAADAIVMLPEWDTSSGARAERFVAEMTGKQVFLAIKQNFPGAWGFVLDPVQKRLTLSVAPVFA